MVPPPRQDSIHVGSGASPRADSVNTGSPTPAEAAQNRDDDGSGQQLEGHKRIRLHLACNQCRKRKVRCDAETPKCRNCWLRDEECETTDPRDPSAGSTVRRWATKNGLLPGQNPAATHRNQASVPKHNNTSPGQQQPGSSGYGATNTPLDWHGWGTTPGSAPISNADSGSADTHEPLRTESWVSKAYRQSTQDHGDNNGDAHDNTHPDVVVNKDEDSQKIKVGATGQETSTSTQGHPLTTSNSILVEAVCNV